MIQMIIGYLMMGTAIVGFYIDDVKKAIKEHFDLNLWYWPPGAMWVALVLMAVTWPYFTHGLIKQVIKDYRIRRNLRRIARDLEKTGEGQTDDKLTEMLRKF